MIINYEYNQYKTSVKMAKHSKIHKRRTQNLLQVKKPSQRIYANMILSKAVG